MSPTVDRLLKWTCGLVSALALFGIMWLMLFDVIGRKYFSHSIPGALEITEILMVVVIFGALPMVSFRSEHIVFDSLDSIVPRAFKGLPVEHSQERSRITTPRKSPRCPVRRRYTS